MHTLLQFVEPVCEVTCGDAKAVSSNNASFVRSSLGDGPFTHVSHLS
jgi:hypothetical protein